MPSNIPTSKLEDNDITHKKTLSDKDSLDIASDVQSSPYFVEWFKDDVVTGDLRKRILLFSRVLLDKAGH